MKTARRVSGAATPSIVDELRARGVTVRIHEGLIQYRPLDLDAATMALLRENQRAIVAELSAPDPCPDCGSRDWWRSVHHTLPICRACFPPLQPCVEALPGSPITWSPHRIGSVAEVPLHEVDAWAPDPHGDPTTQAELDAIREEWGL